VRLIDLPPANIFVGCHRLVSHLAGIISSVGIPFCPDTDAMFFFTLQPEHDHAVGECVAGGGLLSLQLSRDVPGVNAD
jgi:hypothetical protein